MGICSVHGLRSITMDNADNLFLYTGQLWIADYGIEDTVAERVSHLGD